VYNIILGAAAVPGFFLSVFSLSLPTAIKLEKKEYML
jgi:hypothetical protein